MLAHQQLLGLVMSALQSAPAVASLITRQRVRALPENVATAVSVRIVRSFSEALLLGGSAPMDWRTVVGVECVARSGATLAADEAVGPMLQAVHARLMGDTTFLAAGYQLQPDMQIEWDQEELDERIGSAALICTFRHRQAFETLAA